MKDNKNTLIYVVAAALLVVITLVGFIYNKDDDSKRFKEEYESLNDTIAYDNVKYPTVSLDSKNPFVYKTEEEIVDIIKNKTGIIYLGFPKCPWCRNAVNVLSKVNAKEIYYLNIYDIRDEYKVVDGGLKKTKEGSKSYYQMLDLLKDILDDYTISNNDEKYNVQEKRIYVPMVIGIKNGVVVDYHMDTVDLKDNQSPFDLLDKNQRQKLLEIYERINNSVNSDLCDIDSDGGC